MTMESYDFLKQQDLPSGSLYMVATPIGNLGDITLRALHVLNAMDGIACEDTRHSAALLQQFGIHKKCLAIHEHNETEAAQAVVEHLKQNQRWAYISDAGTPGISDPGARLVQAVQKAGFRIVPIPGASAVSTAVSVGGPVFIHSKGQFQFLGFWPHKPKEREALLNEILHSGKTSIFFESPHQIQETLLTLSKTLEPARLTMIGRELTKKFEQLAFIGASEIPQWLEQAESLKGEFVVLVAACPSPQEEGPDHKLLMQWVGALSPFLGSKEIATVLSQILEIPKKTAYQLALDAKNPSR